MNNNNNNILLWTVHWGSTDYKCINVHEQELKFFLKEAAACANAGVSKMIFKGFYTDIRFGASFKHPNVPLIEVLGAFMAGMPWPLFDFERFEKVKGNTGYATDDFVNAWTMPSKMHAIFNTDFGEDVIIPIPQDLLDSEETVPPPPPPKPSFLKKKHVSSTSNKLVPAKDPYECEDEVVDVYFDDDFADDE